MSDLQAVKQKVLFQLRSLCAHCSTRDNFPHDCPVKEISARIESLHGVPLMVNNEFKGAINLQ